jgi:predicted ATPase/DNA-binding winged helix-turn-helix (wHTH) protein
MDTSDPDLASETVTFGPFRLYPTKRVLERDGTRVPLGSRAMDVLIVLTEKAGKVVDRRELIARVWPNVVVEDGNLRGQVAALRKALEDDQARARYIANVPGRGYTFVAPLSRQSSPEPCPGPSRMSTSPATISTAMVQTHSRHGLPPLPIRMVGREALVLKISRALESQRLITLVGPGGIGKTTVAAAVGRDQLASFADGVCFIDLGMLTDAGLVAATLATALGLAAQTADPLPVLLGFLRERSMLLVLDCCEHVIDCVAPLMERILEETQSIHILATSRESLRIAGEQIQRVEPLAGPPQKAELTAAEVLNYPAVQLFVARITATQLDFELHDADAPMVAEICRRLEGLALAIEIVAGRVEAYGIKKTGELLNKQFELVWQGRRTAVPRHQTMSAAIDWSYGLLSEPEQIALRRLAAFRGPFELDAVQHVVADQLLDEPLTTEILATLVDKSLVAVESGNSGIRYRLFDTTRGYLLPKLFDSGEADAVFEHHARYWLQFLEQVGFAEYATFIASIRSALEWSFSERGDPSLGSALAAVAAPLFLELSCVSECYDWMERGLAALPDHARNGPQEMRLLAGLGLSAMVALGNAEETQSALQRGLDIAARLNAAYSALRFLGSLHLFTCRTADFRGALAAAERCAGLARQMVDPSITTMANSMLAAAHHLLGNPQTSQHHCEAALCDAPSREHVHRVYLGIDHRSRALCVSARNLWILGFSDQAHEAANFTLEETRVSEHPVTLGIAFWTVPVFTWAGDWQRAETMLERLSIRAARFSLQPYRAMVLGQQGGLAIRRGDPARGVLLIEEALRMAGANYAMVTTGYLNDLAEGLIALGRIDEALAVLNQASARISACGELLHLPELLRLRGEALARAGSADAECTLRAALHAAQRQEAAAWELRAATSLCRLQRTQGNASDGGDRLAATYARFREGFDTADLRAAAELLRTIGRLPVEPRALLGVPASASA